VTYLAGEESGDCEDWLSVLKPMCIPQMARAPKVAKLREVRSLQVIFRPIKRPIKLQTLPSQMSNILDPSTLPLKKPLVLSPWIYMLYIYLLKTELNSNYNW
jgi:hypothetical protein